MKRITLFFIAFMLLGLVIKAQTTGTVTDSRDSKVYETVKIGTQTWLAENLSYKPSSGNFWAYDNNESNITQSGYLYDWATAKTSCPTGWHLPSDAEWKILEIQLGMVSEKAGYEGFRGKDEGSKLKSVTGWEKYGESLGNGKNTSGLNVLPSGIRTSSGTFQEKKSYSAFWTSTSNSVGTACDRRLSYDEIRIGRNNEKVGYGYSVRCVKD